MILERLAMMSVEQLVLIYNIVAISALLIPILLLAFVVLWMFFTR